MSQTSSKILTPHSLTPLTAFGAGEDTLPAGEGGWGSIFWKTRETHM
jgi:hypothetical protein